MKKPRTQREHFIIKHGAEQADRLLNYRAKIGAYARWRKDAEEQLAIERAASAEKIRRLEIEIMRYAHVLHRRSSK